MRQIWMTLACITIAAMILPELAAAQGRGPTPIGRRGFEWQAEQDLEKERYKETFQALSQLGLEDWKAKMLAWIELTPAGEAAVEIPSSHRVGDVRAKRAEVTARGEAGEAWLVSYGRRAPRTLKVVLTDVDATEVDCPLRGAVGESGNHLGVLLVDGVLHCVERKPDGG